MSRAIVMFAKAPVPGAVKTRLAEGIGEEAAAAFHAAFIADVGATIASVDAASVVAWAGDELHAGFAPLRTLGFRFLEQGSGGLGERLGRVCTTLAGEFDEICVVGSDSPTLLPGHFDEAFASLRQRPVVVGPSFDGGYYLLAFRAPWFTAAAPPSGLHPVFSDIPWSTERVLAATIEAIRATGALFDLLGFWYDVDTIADLDLLRTHLLDYLRSAGHDVASRTAEMLVREDFR